MKYTIYNIEIFNARQFFKEIKDYISSPTRFLYALTTNKSVEVDEYTYNILKDCQYITFNIVNLNVSELKEDLDIKSKLNNDFLIENSLGLTQAEMWFNTLPKEQRLYVQELGHGIFNSILRA